MSAVCDDFPDFDEQEWLMTDKPLVVFLVETGVPVAHAEWIRTQFRYHVRLAVGFLRYSNITALPEIDEQTFTMLQNLLWELLAVVMQLSKAMFGDFQLACPDLTKSNRPLFKVIAGGLNERPK